MSGPSTTTTTGSEAVELLTGILAIVCFNADPREVQKVFQLATAVLLPSLPGDRDQKQALLFEALRAFVYHHLRVADARVFPQAVTTLRGLLLDPDFPEGQWSEEQRTWIQRNVVLRTRCDTIL